MVEGLLKAAHIVEVLANAHRMAGHEDMRREMASLARLFRTLAGEEITGVDTAVDVAAVQSWWQRLVDWLKGA